MHVAFRVARGIISISATSKITWISTSMCVLVRPYVHTSKSTCLDAVSAGTDAYEQDLIDVVNIKLAADLELDVPSSSFRC